MKQPIGAGLVPGAIAVTAGGGVGIAEPAGRLFAESEAVGAEPLREQTRAIAARDAVRGEKAS